MSTGPLAVVAVVVGFGVGLAGAALADRRDPDARPSMRLVRDVQAPPKTADAPVPVAEDDDDRGPAGTGSAVGNAAGDDGDPTPGDDDVGGNVGRPAEVAGDEADEDDDVVGSAPVAGDDDGADGEANASASADDDEAAEEDMAADGEDDDTADEDDADGDDVGDD